MKKFNKGLVAKIILSAACTLVIFFTFGCNPKDEVTSLWDESNIGNRPAPAIDSIGAGNGAWAKLAGVGVLRIYGRNFSLVPEENFVQFDDKKGTVVSSTSTTIDVLSPYLVEDTIDVKVSVHKALSYSNMKNVGLEDPLTLVLSDKFQNIRSLAFDAQGNLYASLVNESGVKLGIKKWDPATGKFVSFVEPPAYAVAYWQGMKFGPGGNLYLVGSQKRIAMVAPTGGAVTSLVTMTDNITSLNDLDFDAEKNIWTGGNVPANKIYSVNTTTKAVTGFPFNGIVRSLRVYNGYLYVAAKRDSSESIYRFKINSSTSLGSEELYFDLTGKYPGNPEVTNIAFSQDGFLLAGLTIDPGMVQIYPGGAKCEKYYNQVLMLNADYGKHSAFAWDKGGNLYVAQDKIVDKTKTPPQAASQLLKINTLRSAAPYYGIN